MKRKKRSVILPVCLASILSVLVLFPVYVLVLCALKEPTSIFELSLLPKSSQIRLENFSEVFERIEFGRYMLNSFIVAFSVTIVALLFHSMAGFAFSHMRFRGKNAIFVGIMITAAIPFSVIMIPLFSTLRALKLVDTHFSLIFIYISTNLPFGILTMKGFFDSIPTELDEAAMIDGASPYQTYWKIVFPTAIPGMISVAVYTLMSVWNEFTIANIFIQSTELQTLSVSLRQFQLQTTTDWGALSAAAALACIPAFLFLIVVQKYLISGMTSGAVKG